MADKYNQARDLGDLSSNEDDGETTVREIVQQVESPVATEEYATLGTSGTESASPQDPTTSEIDIDRANNMMIRLMSQFMIQIDEKLRSSNSELKDSLSSQLNDKLADQSNQLKDSLSAQLNEKFAEQSTQLEDRLTASFNARLVHLEQAIIEKTSQLSLETKQLSENIVQMEKNFQDRTEQLSRDLSDKTSQLEQKLTDTTSQIRTELEEKLEEQMLRLNINFETKVDKVKTEVDKNVSDIRAEIVDNEHKILSQLDSRKRELEAKVNDLQEKIDGLPAGPMTTHPMMVSLPQGLTFGAHGKENPCAFIKAVENFFTLYNLPESKKVRLVYQMLVSNAKIWADTLDPLPTSMEGFKEKFFMRYWNHETQVNFRLKLMCSTWKKGQSMQDYATEKLAGFRLCSPTIPESETVCLIIRHFPIGIQNLLKSQLPMTAEKLVTQLGLYDATYEMSGKQDTTKPTSISSAAIIQTSGTNMENGNVKKKGKKHEISGDHEDTSTPSKVAKSAYYQPEAAAQLYNAEKGKQKMGKDNPTPSTSKDPGRGLN